MMNPAPPTEPLRSREDLTRPAVADHIDRTGQLEDRNVSDDRRQDRAESRIRSSERDVVTLRDIYDVLIDRMRSIEDGQERLARQMSLSIIKITQDTTEHLARIEGGLGQKVMEQLSRSRLAWMIGGFFLVGGAPLVYDHWARLFGRLTGA